MQTQRWKGYANVLFENPKITVQSLWKSFLKESKCISEVFKTATVSSRYIYVGVYLYGYKI